MTFAWYGHLKFKEYPIWIAILGSWGIAFFEYVIQVPANRIGSGSLSLYQLKILQECITLAVFIGFALFYYNEGFKPKYVISFLFVVAAVAISFRPD